MADSLRVQSPGRAKVGPYFFTVFLFSFQPKGGRFVAASWPLYRIGVGPRSGIG
jgi:hypothetical protein